MKKWIARLMVLATYQLLIYIITKDLPDTKIKICTWIVCLYLIYGGYGLSYLDNFSLLLRSVKRIENKASKGIYHFEKIDIVYQKITKLAKEKQIEIDEFNFLYNRLKKIDIRTHENVTHP